MAGSPSISIRLNVAGAVELKQQLENAGNVGGAALDKIRSGLERLGAQNSGAVTQAIQAATQRLEQLKTSVAQAQVANFAGIGPQVDYKARSADIAAYGASLDALRSKYNPLFAASKQYEATLEEISGAEKVGALSAVEAAAARDRVTASFAKAQAPVAANTNALKDHANASTAASFATRNLGIQTIQTVSGLATGQPVLLTLVQQGHQVFDSMLAGGQGMSSLGTAAKGMLAAVGGIPTLLGVGVVAGLGLMVKASDESAGRLNSLKVVLRGTHDDYAALAQGVEDAAKRVSASSGLGFDEALVAARTIAQGRFFSGTSADIERLTHVAENLGTVMGGGAAQGSKILSDAQIDVSKAAQSLSGVLSATLTPEVLRQIDLTERAGNKNAAYLLLLGAIERGTQNAAKEGLSPLSKAWQDLGNAFTSSTAGWNPFITGLAEGVASTVASTAKEVRALIDALHTLRDAATAVGSIPSMIRQQAAAGGVDNDGMPIGSATGQAVTTTTAATSAVSSAVSVATPTTSATKEAFVANWTDAARQAGAQLGVSPSVLLAQWGLETRWGQSAYNNNAGNIKPGANYAGDVFTNPGDKQNYRSYADPAAFAKDFAEVVAQKWPGVRNTGTNAAAYAAALRPGQQGGYAEDPNYVNKLTSAASSIGLGASPSTLVNDAKSIAESVDSLAKSTQEVTAQNLEAKLEAIHKAMDQVAASSGTTSEQYTALKQAEAEVIAQQYKNVDALEAARRAADSSLAANQGLEAGERGLSAAIEARRLVALNAGLPFGSAEQQQATLEYLAKQSQAADQLAGSLSKTVGENQAMVAAYVQGDQAVLDATAKQRAYNDAVALFPASAAQQGQAIAALAPLYRSVATSAAEAQVAQKNLASNDNIAYLQTEIATLGMNEAARSRLLTTMKAEQEAHRQFGDILPPEAQRYVELAGKVAGMTSAYQQQQGALAEVSGFFTNTFDTIASSITQAFATGQLQALKFKDIMKSVASAVIAEFAKLAVLNPLKDLLFGTVSPNLLSVGGAIGSLLGNGGATAAVAGSAGVTGAAGLASAFSGGGTTLSGGGGSFNDPISFGTVAAGTQLVDKVLEGTSGATEGLVAGLAGKITDSITTALGNFGQAATIVDAAGASGNAALIGASVSNALGLSDSTAGIIASATGQIADALPYIGAAISVVTSIASGDYRGAAITATTAAIGAYVGSIVATPGIGTAIGAAVGSLISAFLPNHPKHPYSNIDLNIQGGQLTTENGYDVGQLTNLSADKAGVQAYADSINAYLKQVGVVITNADVTLGHIGSGITGFNRAGLTTGQTADVTTLFKNLSFGGDPNDKSNFGIAKGALQGMSFNSPVDLQNELYKIAGFADAVDALGINLASVGKDISAIQIASVTNTKADALSTVKDATGREVSYHGDLRTALNADLPSKTFADVAALDAEMQKVSDFVTGTLPSLLTPVKVTSSSLQDQIKVLNHQYADAMEQSKSYGLNNDASLLEAEKRAIDIMMKPAIDAVTASMAGINVRFATASYGSAGAGGSNIANLAATQQTERNTLEDQWRQTWGDTIVTADSFREAMQRLIDTQNAEIQVAQAQIAYSQQSTANTIRANALSYQQRDDIATQGAASMAATLASYDVKAAQERLDFVKSWTDAYGQQIVASADFQFQMALVDKTHYDERLALQKQYQGQSMAALKQAQGSVASLFTSFKDYALKLQVGSQSPLAPLAQYDLAKSQFNAVSGAARAGDAPSAQQLTNYADALLTASQAVNGSGAAYASDFTKVLDALQATAGASDALTQSFMRQQIQEQTDTLNTAIVNLQGEVGALRREVQLSTARKAQAA